MLDPAELNVPASQGMQVFEGIVVTLEYFPATQGSHRDAPVEETLPSAHDAQDEARDAEYLPGEQYKQVPEPEPEKNPA